MASGPRCANGLFSGEDWWVASGVIFNRHHWHDYYDWADVNTVSGLDDVRADVLGSGKNHPKVYVGLYSHSAYRSKCDIGCGNLVNTGPLVWNEYRSSDWFRLVQASDLTLYSDLPEAWGTDTKLGWAGLNHPWKAKRECCRWEVQDGRKAEGSQKTPHKIPPPCRRDAACRQLNVTEPSEE